MLKTSSLYLLAEKRGIPVIPASIPENGSMCIQTGLRCYIGIDLSALENGASEKVHIAHELGHCETGGFYNRYSPLDVRQKHENAADKWAIQHLIPRSELEEAVSAGHTDVWDLAEYFDVTEDFIKKAICFYRNGNVAVELYE